MKEINLLDIFYTGGKLFLVFYGAIIITNLLTKKKKEQDSKESEGK
ncbi:hypothetical protein PGH07_08595 [Sulfurovum sp. zt1-1]|uniref:Hmc operon protein 4 n=1 Tax=Sulfurovum zhangzhouensis TaxID=3019067 RepID=A0ABT7QZF6_9BACT|nr:hypothetical protein [Sulfurovum zhangzhouensis]MDM5272238.1 hypothetical protein [Sulfurovum zhangzhouensis]